LGITTDAVRMRLSRGTLASEKREGRVYVLLDDDLTGDTTGDSPNPSRELLDAKDETIRLLTEQLEAERRANEQNRQIIAALTQRIPELEPPPEARESPVPPPDRAEPHPVTEAATERRSWWRRVFGG
jgi:hypothetical protein